MTLIFLLLLGCASDDSVRDTNVLCTPKDTESEDAADTGDDPCGQGIASTDEDGNLHVAVTDAQNMRFRSELTIAVQTLKARSDFTIDWSNLSVDMLKHEIDPLTGVDRLQMVVWKLSEADLLVKLNNDDLAMAEVEAVGWVPTNHERTQVRYLEMMSPGGVPLEEETLLGFVDPDQYDPALYSYTVMTAGGNNLELGFKMLHLLRFSSDVQNTEVNISNESTTLDYEVDIVSSDTILLPADNPDIVVEWENSVKENALGNPFIPQKIWYVNVAHYPDMDVGDLEDNFLDIEYIAEDLYTAEITSGFSVNLSTLVDEAGDSFEGINPDGTWIIALMCGDCANPAPWFLSVLQAC